jgi:hypothetical protein
VFSLVLKALAYIDLLGDGGGGRQIGDFFFQFCEGKKIDNFFFFRKAEFLVKFTLKKKIRQKISPKL